jgi:hypothetical protein
VIKEKCKDLSTWWKLHEQQFFNVGFVSNKLLDYGLFKDQGILK